MQAYRAEVTVNAQGEIHLREVPFRPGAMVEVIVLEPPDTATTGRSPQLEPDRQAALARTLGRSYPLGGQFPARDELHER